jgi:hypothetical protein
MQTGDPVQPLRQSSSRQYLAVLIDDLDIVMVLGPVISYEQHRASRSELSSAARRRQPAI